MAPVVAKLIGGDFATNRAVLLVAKFWKEEFATNRAPPFLQKSGTEFCNKQGGTPLVAKFGKGHFATNRAAHVVAKFWFGVDLESCPIMGVSC